MLNYCVFYFRNDISYYSSRRVIWSDSAFNVSRSKLLQIGSFQSSSKVSGINSYPNKMQSNNFPNANPMHVSSTKIYKLTAPPGRRKLKRRMSKQTNFYYPCNDTSMEQNSNSFNLRMQENADGTINIPSINSDTIIICEVTLPGVPKYKVVREKAILPYSGKAEANKGLCKIDLIFPISIKLAKSYKYTSVDLLTCSFFCIPNFQVQIARAERHLRNI